MKKWIIALITLLTLLCMTGLTPDPQHIMFKGNC